MIEFYRLQEKENPYFDYFNSIYEASFPIHEQRTLQGRAAILVNTNFYALIILSEDIPIGIVGGWQCNKWFYIEHFAIEDKYRSHGYGNCVLSALKQQYKQIVLEIDPLVDEASNKRFSFYQRGQFKKNDYLHYHPSYTYAYSPHQLVLLSFPSLIHNDEYNMFNTFLKRVVMKSEYL